MPGTMRVEFHCHTIFSEDSLVRPDRIIASARRKRLDRIVITDHNTLAGARLAREMEPDMVIVGEEIMTTRGEILAAFVTEEVPEGLTPLETIRRLRNQGAFISISHPFDRLRSGHWPLEDLVALAPLVDAVEVFNARCMISRFNCLAAQFSQEHRLPGTVGSDAHAAFELGAAVMVLPQFKGPEGLRDVIGRAQYQVHRSPLWVHFVSRYASFLKKIQKPYAIMGSDD